MILQMLLCLLPKSIFSQKVHEEIEIVLKPMDMVSDYFVRHFYFLPSYGTFVYLMALDIENVILIMHSLLR